MVTGRPNIYSHSQVLSLYDTGISIKEIGQKLNMEPSAVNKIIGSHPEHKRRTKHIQKQGEKHNRAKLTEKEVTKIIAARNSGETYKEISIKYNVHSVTIRDIYTGKSWPHLQYLKKPK